MKESILISLIILTHCISGLSNSWVKTLGEEQATVSLEEHANDSESNTIVTGTFASEYLKVDAVNTLQNKGVKDVFLIKYSREGDLVWAISFGGAKEEEVNDICIDNEDNIYLTGHFKSTSMEIENTQISSAWPCNVYIAKFDKHGVFQWLRHSTQVSNYAKGMALALDKNQDVLFTGFLRSNALSFGTYQFTFEGGYEKGYYGHISKDGDFLRAGVMKGKADDRFQINDISVDPSGNIYLTGKKTITILQDPGPYEDYRDMLYYCKIDPGDEISWAREDTTLYKGELITYRNDSLYILANKEEYRIIFNGGTIDTTSAFYFSVMDPDANILWEKRITGALAYDACVIDSRIVILGGLLLDHLDFGDLELHRNSDSSSICPIYQDIFYLGFDKAGQIKDVLSISGSLEDIPTGISITNSGDLVYSGIFESYKLEINNSVLINNSTLNTFKHVSGTYYDRTPYSFLARKSAYTKPANIPDLPAAHLRISPNPSSGIIRIEQQIESGMYTVRIYNIQGKCLYNDLHMGNDISINLAGLDAGLYFVSLSAKNSFLKSPLLLVR